MSGPPMAPAPDGRSVAYREPDRGRELTALAYWGARIRDFGELRLI